MLFSSESLHLYLEKKTNKKTQSYEIINHMILGLRAELTLALKTIIHWWITYELPHDKTNKVSVRPTKTQISLGIRPV